ncbi:EAL domain-containing protein [Cupriavidus gilardii]|uniref:EAL domain-containing protein n=1 Tax=Cupriavidus gilardii TaxID=82541 RepID=UPI001EE5AC40|nr:EAL domain-containing protein [Cupriavidus gilardii]MCG5260565.1 EAL domain-containing protein [Cupriavidus gilardii]MDF9428412.1 EAL domain-containing protein [Cupriavidus gilardii]
MTARVAPDRHPAPSDDGTQPFALFRGDRGAAALEALLNGLPHPVLVKDRAHRWLLLNDQMCELMGHSRDTLLGRTDHDFLPREQADGYWAVDDEVFDTGEEREVEESLTAADGSTRVLSTRKRRVMLIGPAGAPLPVVIASIVDITNIRRAQSALRESEEHYRHSVELNPQVPWTADAQGLVSEAGPRWEELTGRSVEQGKGTGWAEQVHPDDLDETLRRWRTSVDSGAPFDKTFRLRMRSGEYRWFRSRAAPRRDSEGRVMRWYGTLEDIDDRMRVEAALRESARFSRSILENSPNCIRVLDLDGRVLYANATAYRLLEIDEDEPVLGERWIDLLPPTCRADAGEALDAARAGGIGSFTIRRHTRSGAVQWLDTVTASIPGEQGRPARLLAISLDATEARQAREEADRAQREAQQLAQRLSAVLESTMDSVIVIDRDWRLTYFNGNAARALQERGPAIGRSLWDMFPEEADGVFARHYRRALDEQVPVAFEEYLPPLAIWLEVHAYPTTEGLSIFFRNITERRRAEQERLAAQQRLAYLSRHDALTGTPNRVALREHLEQLLRRQRRRIALHCVDLSGFKGVNDTFGHAVGDAVLRQVAERLRSCLTEADTIARLGSDEFVVVQTPLADGEQAAVLARRIQACLSEPFTIDGHTVTIGASVGIAVAPEHGDQPDDLLRAADIALDRAKREGPGTVLAFHADMDAQLRARVAIKRDLHQALADGQLLLHYQPVYDLRSGEIRCFEALLRWQHPERGMISPAEFVPMAEETGLIVPIGAWVLREASRQAAAWPAAVAVAVNLSPLQFRDPALADTVRHALQEAGLSPARLQLEITESVLLQESQSNRSTLQALREIGVRIAMDDFGTGYSSLGYLRSFAFDKIKLDRSFVTDVRGNDEARAILHAVASLGAAFRLVTTAEGIETASQLAAVREEGYDEGQGYLFSPPVPAEQALRLIERGASEHIAGRPAS